MCLVAILAVLAYLVVATFFITARILLPWTIAATILAGLGALGLAVALRPRMGRAAVALSLPITFALTICFGYLGVWLVPPQPPPKQPPSQDPLAVLFTLPKPDVIREDLQTMLPIHLCISGLLGGVIAASVAISSGLVAKTAATNGEKPLKNAAVNASTSP